MYQVSIVADINAICKNETLKHLLLVVISTENREFKPFLKTNCYLY